MAHPVRRLGATLSSLPFAADAVLSGIVWSVLTWTLMVWWDVVPATFASFVLLLVMGVGFGPFAAWVRRRRVTTA